MARKIRIAERTTDLPFCEAPDIGPQQRYSPHDASVRISGAIRFRRRLARGQDCRCRIARGEPHQRSVVRLRSAMISFFFRTGGWGCSAARRRGLVNYSAAFFAAFFAVIAPVFAPFLAVLAAFFA